MRRGAAVVALALLVIGCGPTYTASSAPAAPVVPPSSSATSSVASGAVAINSGPSSGASSGASSSSAPKPTRPDPAVCGSWLQENVYPYFSSRYGEIRNCGLVGTQWVLTTLGTGNGSTGTGTTGIVALYACKSGDNQCLDGQNPHPVSGWKVFTPPHVGGVTIMGNPTPDCLMVENAGGQIYFNLATHAFGQTCP